MKLLKIILMLFFGSVWSYAQPVHHQMQHGFVLSADDQFGSHLVATGHHSRQAEIKIQLVIEDKSEGEVYTKQKSLNINGDTYFLFQAQNVDLPILMSGQILTGHIVESKVGKYESQNIIVKKAILKVERVILNIENPFFGDQ